MFGTTLSGGGAVWLGLAACGLVGCASPQGSPDLGELYSDAAMRHGPERNPIIVIPGILGSKLVDADTGQPVWGAFVTEAASPADAEGSRLIAHPMEPGTPLQDLRDRVVADGALDSLSVSLLPGLTFRVKAYRNILLALGAGGYRDSELGESGAIDYGTDHYTCFQFAYDWRRSSAENALLLDAFIEEKAAEVARQNHERYGSPADAEVRFDIVAHSMGTLVTRYYLRYGSVPLPSDPDKLPRLTWAGARKVDKVVLVSSPNAGSAYALEQLTQGLPFPLFLPDYPAALIATMPSVYELLPRRRHGVLVGQQVQEPGHDPLDVALWEEKEWGLLNPEQDEILVRLLPGSQSREERRRTAIDHLVKCLRNAGQFQRALDRRAVAPDGLDLVLYTGDAVATPVRAFATQREIVLDRERTQAGDGTVARYSALMDERHPSTGRERALRLESPVPWDDINFIHRDHLGITSDPTFTDSLLFHLLER